MNFTSIRAGNPVGILHNLLGVTLSDIAKELEVTPSMVSAINVGKRQLPREYFEQVADMIDENLPDGLPQSLTKREKKFFEAIETYGESVAENLRRESRR